MVAPREWRVGERALCRYHGSAVVWVRGRVIGARRPGAHRREEPEPKPHRFQFRGLLEGRRRVELRGVGAPGERLPELLAEV